MISRMSECAYDETQFNGSPLKIRKCIGKKTLGCRSLGVGRETDNIVVVIGGNTACVALSYDTQ